MSQVLEPRVVNAKKGAACWALNPTLSIERHNAPHWPWPARVTATINHVLAIPGGGVWRLDKLTSVVVVLRGRPTRVQNDTNLAARRSATHAARKWVLGALHPCEGAQTTCAKAFRLPLFSKAKPSTGDARLWQSSTTSRPTALKRPLHRPLALNHRGTSRPTKTSWDPM